VVGADVDEAGAAMDEARFITGHVIPIDARYTAQRPWAVACAAR
jgi:hypothetical protein